MRGDAKGAFGGACLQVAPLLAGAVVADPANARAEPKIGVPRSAFSRSSARAASDERSLKRRAIG